MKSTKTAAIAASNLRRYKKYRILILKPAESRQKFVNGEAEVP